MRTAVMSAAAIIARVAEVDKSVLGELVAGVIVGNLSLVGIGSLKFITVNAGIAVLAQLGVVLLLFEVGLASTVRDMLQVGLRSLVVAVLGVITPWALGWWVGAL